MLFISFDSNFFFIQFNFQQKKIEDDEKKRHLKTIIMITTFGHTVKRKARAFAFDF